MNKLMDYLIKRIQTELKYRVTLFKITCYGTLALVGVRVRDFGYYLINKSVYKLDTCTLNDNRPCEHENDGYCYTSDPIQYKCRKCGEFYR